MYLWESTQFLKWLNFSIKSTFLLHDKIDRVFIKVFELNLEFRIYTRITNRLQELSIKNIINIRKRKNNRVYILYIPSYYKITTELTWHSFMYKGHLLFGYFVHLSFNYALRSICNIEAKTWFSLLLIKTMWQLLKFLLSF